MNWNAQRAAPADGCRCGHGAYTEPRTRWEATSLAYHHSDIADLLAVVDSDPQRWLRVLRCVECGRYWAEDSMSSGHADMSYIYPIETEDPHGWLAHARSLRLPPGERPTLRHIGRWGGPGEEGWPDPAAFVDPGADRAAQRRTADYLRAGTTVLATPGLTPCRLCGRQLGSALLTDGAHLTWPEGLVHYLEQHDVLLPDEITAMMREPPPPVDTGLFARDVFQAARVSIDCDWWGSLAASVTGGTGSTVREGDTPDGVGPTPPER
jgi:hypothetical protein